MEDEVKVPEGGEQKTEEEQKQDDNKREVDYNKFREFQRKAEKGEKYKEENAALKEELARLRGQAEIMSGAKRPDISIEDELASVERILEDPSIFDRPFAEYNDLQNRRASLLRKLSNKTASDTTDSKLKDFKVEQDLLFKYGRIMEADKTANERYQRIIKQIPNVTAEQRLAIADEVFGDAIKERTKQSYNMTTFSMGGYSSDGTESKFSAIASDPENQRLAKQSIANGLSKNEEEYYEKLHNYKLAHDPAYKG